MRGVRFAVVSSTLLFLFGTSAPYPTAYSDIACGDLSTSSPTILISEFYPCAMSNDEYVILTCVADFGISLLNWSLSDGEGTIKFLKPLVVGSMGSLAISMNSTSFEKAYNKPPNVSLGPGGCSSAGLVVCGSFRLSDVGDSLCLRSPLGAVVDSAYYGETSDVREAWSGASIASARQGEVLRRIEVGGSILDSDTSLDWMPFREFRYGYTDHVPVTAVISPGDLEAFVSPDCALDVIVHDLETACKSIRVCSYEFDSVPIANALLNCARRGVEVRMLLDGAPAGGMSAREVACLSALAVAGVDVAVTFSRINDGVVQHIGALHSKYIVIDECECVVQSENFVEVGVPVDRLYGNRGWGVEFRSPSLGLYLASLFDDDGRTSRVDIRSWTADPRFNRSGTLPQQVKASHQTGVLEPLISSSPSTVTLYASPDCSQTEPFVLDLIADSKSILAEQFQCDLLWKTRWSVSTEANPILQELVDLVRRDCSASILFDSSWFSAETNNASLEFLTEQCAGSIGHSCFALMDRRAPTEVLHNKGFVVDSEMSVVSSNNWVYASFAKNRELAALVGSEEVAIYFERVFTLDSVPDTTPPVADAGPDLTVDPGQNVTISGAGSHDDRAMSDFMWDIDSDGDYEERGEDISLSFSLPGTYEIELTASDSWGNEAMDTLVVFVRGGGEVHDDPSDHGSRSSSVGLDWVVPVIVAIAAIAVSRARSLRKDSARKLNHGRKGSR